MAKNKFENTSIVHTWTGRNRVDEEEVGLEIVARVVEIGILVFGNGGDAIFVFESGTDIGEGTHDATSRKGNTFDATIIVTKEIHIE